MTRINRISRAPVLSATFNRDSCCTMTTAISPPHDGHDPPALVVRQRPCLHDLYLVTDLALVLLVVRLELGRLPNVLLVLGVLLEGLHADYHRLIHLVADDGAGPGLAHGAIRRFLYVGHACSSAPRRRRGLGAGACGATAGSGLRSVRWMVVRIWARSSRTWRIWRWFCSWPVAIWKRRLNSSWRESLSFFCKSSIDNPWRSFIFISCHHPWPAWPVPRRRPSGRHQERLSAQRRVRP